MKYMSTIDCIMDNWPQIIVALEVPVIVGAYMLKKNSHIHTNTLFDQIIAQNISIYSSLHHLSECILQWESVNNNVPIWNKLFQIRWPAVGSCLQIEDQNN
ncbi:hypothetical protein ACJX0J_018818 [Zea mays]